MQVPNNQTGPFAGPRSLQMHLKTMLSLSLSLRCAVGFPHATRFHSKRPFSSSSSAQCQWSGLESWRESSLNDNRRWGCNGPEPFLARDEDPTANLSSLAEWGTLVLSTSDPFIKSKLSHLAYSRWRCHNLPIGLSQPPDRPARPPKPDLVRSLLLSPFDYVNLPMSSILSAI